MAYRFIGLDPNQFKHLFGESDDALKAQGIKRYSVTEHPGFPDRIDIADLAIGETALLLNYEHHSADTPYRSSHAIFIGEHSRPATHAIDTVPEAIQRRLISLRAFDYNGEMIDADVVEGIHLEPLISAFFDNANVAFLHAHYAKRGCYAGLVQRA